MVKVKGKILLLISVLFITSITVAAYPVMPINSQLGQSNQLNAGNIANNNHKTSSPNKISNVLAAYSSANLKKSAHKKHAASKVRVKSSRSRSIAQKYIGEPNAVAGKPERYKIGGKCTDVVPVLLRGKRVGEIDIDPKTGKNVGGAGGAP